MTDGVVKEAWKYTAIMLIVLVAILVGVIMHQNNRIMNLEDINYHQCTLTNNIIDTLNSASTLIEKSYGEPINKMTHMDCTVFGG